MSTRSAKRVAYRYAAKTAAMKTPSNLPEGWYVEISGSLSNVGIYLMDDRDNTVGSLDIHRTGNFLQINEIQAQQGWGPLLYDLALEVANEFDDDGLMPDRSMVSREAQAVWDHYLNRRSDVEATPLPDSVLELGGAGHVRTRLDRYESDSPLSYSYRKTTGNPFMRQLASQGQLESDDYSFSLPAVRSASRHRMVLSLDSHEVKAPRGWVHIEEVEIIPDPKGMFDPTGQDHEILTVDWVMDPDGPDEATHIGMSLRDFLRLTGLSKRVVNDIVADAYEDQASEYEDRLSYRAATSTREARKKVQYKGRSYYLVWSGPTRYGERAKLQYLDGTKEFWVNADAISSRGSGGRSRCRGCGGPIRNAPHHRAMEGYCGYCAFDEFDM